MFNCNPCIAHWYPLPLGGGILVDHWSTISSFYCYSIILKGYLQRSVKLSVQKQPITHDLNKFWMHFHHLTYMELTSYLLSLQQWQFFNIQTLLTFPEIHRFLPIFQKIIEVELCAEMYSNRASRQSIYRLRYPNPKWISSLIIWYLFVLNFMNLSWQSILLPAEVL